MKPFVLTIICLLFGLGTVSGQISVTGCPKIEVIGPELMLNPGDTADFKANVEDARSHFKYEWSVSAGTIESGQGTSSIKVRTTEANAGTTIVATILVKGLPWGCSDKASEALFILSIVGCDAPSDEFGKLKPNDIRARIDQFFVELQNNPTNSGVILFGLTEEEAADHTNPRFKLIVDHAKLRKFDVSRLVFKFEPSELIHTKLWRMPPGVEAPCPECTTIYGAVHADQ